MLHECLQLACACAQKSPHSARAGGEAGWAEHRLRGSLHRNTPEVRNSFKRNGFPQTEQALDGDPCQSPPLLLAVTLLYQRFVFWVCYCVCLQVMLHVTQHSPFCSEKNPALKAEGLLRDFIYCFAGRNCYLLKLATQAVAEQKLPGQSTGRRKHRSRPSPAPRLATAEISHTFRTLSGS